MDVAELLEQGILGQSQSVDMHADHFFWKKYIAETAESIVNPAAKLLLVLFWPLSGISKVVYRVCNAPSLGVIGEQVLH